MFSTIKHNWFSFSAYHSSTFEADKQKRFRAKCAAFMIQDLNCNYKKKTHCRAILAWYATPCICRYLDIFVLDLFYSAVIKSHFCCQVARPAPGVTTMFFPDQNWQKQVPTFLQTFWTIAREFFNVNVIYVWLKYSFSIKNTLESHNSQVKFEIFTAYSNKFKWAHLSVIIEFLVIVAPLTLSDFSIFYHL